MMGDVVPFGRRESSQEGQVRRDSAEIGIPVLRSGTRAHDAMFSALEGLMGSIPGLEITVRCLTMERHIDSLKGVLSPANVDLRREALKTLSDNEISKMVLDSDELVWTKHPSLYRALIQEVKDRGL